MKLKIRPLEAADQDWITELLTSRWGSCKIVTRGRVHQANALPGFIAERKGQSIGLLTYFIDEEQCEIISLDSLQERSGVGSALLREVEDAARHSNCTRLWLITTNDNFRAMNFYQKRGFTLRAVHKGAVNYARKLKPEIPSTSPEGVPLEDEWEFERFL